MKLADAPKVLLTNPTLVAVPGRLPTPARIFPIPSLTSSIESALTKSPWPFIAACQRSSTPELSGVRTSGTPRMSFGCGHCSNPAGFLRSASTATWSAAGSLPDVPSDSAAKFKCSHLAEYRSAASGGVLLVGTLAGPHNGQAAVGPGRKVVTQ